MRWINSATKSNTSKFVLELFLTYLDTQIKLSYIIKQI